MVAGKETFIDAMIQACGMVNVAETMEGRYPSCSIDEIVTMAPDYLLLSSEPFPFAEKHILTLNEMVPNSKAVLVDGEFFSWYGSRLLLFENYWNKTVQTLIKSN
jgi:ABC-type Fe3+-hydroxamate transport system substrate-binding protein